MEKKINVGIHIYRNGQFSPFAAKFIEILELNNISWIKLDINQSSFWDNLKECTHFIFHWGGLPDSNNVAKSFMSVIESHLKMPIFPNLITTWHHDDKIRQYYLLKNAGFPIIESNIFWNKLDAIKYVKSANYPIVFKLKSSAGSKDVVLCKNSYHAKRIVNKMFGKGVFLGKVPGNYSIKFKDLTLKKVIDQWAKKINRRLKGKDVNLLWQKEKNYVLFQKFLPENNYDTRITIIGNKAFAFRRHNRENDFRSSGSGKIDYDMSQIDHKLIKLALEISNIFGFQSMAYDFLSDSGVPALCEMSYTYLDFAIYNCPGYFAEDLTFIKGHFWPQKFILEDLLNISDMDQPEFNKMEVHRNKTIFNFFK